MASRAALLLLLVLLAGTAQAHHGGPHQSTEPGLEWQRTDCSKVSAFIRKWEVLRNMLHNHKKTLRPQEAEELEKAKSIFDTICREV